MIGSTQIANTEIFTFIAAQAFLYKQKRRQKLAKKQATFLKNRKLYG